MLKPSVNDLIQNDESIYALVVATAKHARQIAQDADERGETLDEKPVSIAIRDIYEGKVRIV